MPRHQFKCQDCEKEDLEIVRFHVEAIDCKCGGRMTKIFKGGPSVKFDKVFDFKTR